MSSAVELSERNVESVLGLSVRYGVSALVEQCCGFLAGSISVSNAFGILTVADVSPHTSTSAVVSEEQNALLERLVGFSCGGLPELVS